MTELECKPLSKLEEIAHWENYVTPSVVPNLQKRTEFSVSGKTYNCHTNDSFEWQPVKLIKEKTPSTLVCHDMKGGYVEDRFINGTTTENAYRFFSWAGVDIFVYFSHNLLTIPPPGWISAGHIHGVKVLGTFITEWDAGEAILNEILSDDETRKLYVEKMVDICDKFSFDGYLLNVENKLKSELIPSLQTFIQDLHEMLKLKLPHSELIWYDSIIIDGTLKWQNELNCNNKPFFDLCDGILLNYPWKEDNLERSAFEAGSRTKDVYAGIDVFGRGSFGGGGFGSALAMKEARRHGLSAAFFAPGWTHEVLGGVHFACTELLFWAHVCPFLFLRGPASLPIATSFCQGFGRKGRAQQGKFPATKMEPWYHLSSQRLQPTAFSCLDCRCLPTVEVRQCEEKKTDADGETAAPPPAPIITPAPDCGGTNRGCVQHYEEDAFEGGGCLKITRRSSEGDGISLHRLLLCDVVSSSGIMNIIYATKDLSNSIEFKNTSALRLGLVVRTTISSEPKIVWVNDYPGHAVERSKCGKKWTSMNSDSVETNLWKVFKYSMPSTEHINEIFVGLPSGCNSALLGWLEISDTEM